MDKLKIMIQEEHCRELFPGCNPVVVTIIRECLKEWLPIVMHVINSLVKTMEMALENHLEEIGEDFQGTEFAELLSKALQGKVDQVKQKIVTCVEDQIFSEQEPCNYNSFQK